MATGSGKTFTAVSFLYRLIEFAGARRVLFLVDRSNLGVQAKKEFEQYHTDHPRSHFPLEPHYQPAHRCPLIELTTHWHPSCTSVTLAHHL